MSRAEEIPLHRSAIETGIRGVPGTAADTMTCPFTQFLTEAAVAA